MISCVEWVPEGAADPNPKRFELSKAEMEMLEEQVNMAEEAYKADDANTDASSVEDADDNAASSGGGKIELETVHISTLPADLRMDEYSDDEGEDAKRGSRLGNLLIGKETELVGTHMDKDGMPAESFEDDVNESDKASVSSEEDDSDEDLADAPDTREFMPVNVEGLEAMGLSASGLGGQMNFGLEEEGDDDNSDLDDTNLRPGDAMVIIAKTEEVRTIVVAASVHK